MKKTIIFVQASRDLIYALSLYSRCADDQWVEFYVIDHQNNYDYLESLSLKNCSITFIKNRSLKNPLYLITERFRLNALFKKYFSNLKSCDVFYFSNYFDIKTFFFLSKLSSRNKVTLCDHYKLDRQKVAIRSLGGLIRVGLAYIATGIFLGLSIDQKVLIFGTEARLFDSVDSNSITVNVSQYKIQPDTSGKAIVLFDSNDELSLKIGNYRFVLEEVVNRLLSKNFIIFVKPHPRLGYSEFLNKYPITLLPAETPVELIDFSAFVFALGNASAALSGCETLKGVLSVIRLLEYDDMSKVAEYEGYLKGMDGSILFLDSLEDLNQILEA